MLVDVVAALPMEHVVRMARLGHERLCQACSLKWVTDRMKNVTFRQIVRAHQAGGDVAETFCTNSITKRLKGKMEMTNIDLRSPRYVDACTKISKTIQGRLHFSLEGYDSGAIPYNVMALRPLTYVSQCVKRDFLGFSAMGIFPEILFNYIYYPKTARHYVSYRPALLNGRHVVDVLRAVCGPADVSEAELDRVRREGREEWGSVWRTTWWGKRIIAQV